MKQVRIGDELLYVPYNGSQKTAIVVNIEICRIGEKYGNSVNSCDIDQHSNGTITLSNHHWCYFDQVKQVITKKEMAKTKKMTLKYWAGLSEGSKRRALTYCFPLHKATVDMLMNDEPNPKNDAWWGLVWRKVRIPEADANGYRHYKIVVNNTYIP